MKMLATSFLLALFSFSAQAAELNCTSYSSKILGHEVHYCVDRSTPEIPAQPGEPVVYFMHGTNGSAKTWKKNNYQYSLEALRESQQLQPMTFVSFDTSAYSFFADHPVKNGSTQTKAAYETWFIQEFIPYIEKTLQVCDKRSCRGVMGESMGGLGALNAAFRHPDLFSTVAVNSPALSPFETRESFLDWIKFFAPKGVGPLKGILVTCIFFHVFPDEESFDEHNPTYLVEHYASDVPVPRIYFDMGGKDSYGFFEGYHRLKDALDRKQIPYTTDFEPKGHHDMWMRHASDALMFMQENLN